MLVAPGPPFSRQIQSSPLVGVKVKLSWMLKWRFSRAEVDLNNVSMCYIVQMHKDE